jgi:hypothetical protein
MFIAAPDASPSTCLPGTPVTIELHRTADLSKISECAMALLGRTSATPAERPHFSGGGDMGKIGRSSFICRFANAKSGAFASRHADKRRKLLQTEQAPPALLP